MAYQRHVHCTRQCFLAYNPFSTHSAFQVFLMVLITCELSFLETRCTASLLGLLLPKALPG